MRLNSTPGLEIGMPLPQHHLSGMDVEQLPYPFLHAEGKKG
jgi:hypothetical protein